MKVQIDEERDQRREEREKAAADAKAAVQKAHAEAQDELKRLSDAALRREREQQEVINKLQVSISTHNQSPPSSLKYLLKVHL